MNYLGVHVISYQMFGNFLKSKHKLLNSLFFFFLRNSNPYCWEIKGKVDSNLKLLF